MNEAGDIPYSNKAASIGPWATSRWIQVFQLPSVFKQSIASQATFPPPLLDGEVGGSNRWLGGSNLVLKVLWPVESLSTILPFIQHKYHPLNNKWRGPNLWQGVIIPLSTQQVLWTLLQWTALTIH